MGGASIAAADTFFLRHAVLRRLDGLYFAAQFCSIDLTAAVRLSRRYAPEEPRPCAFSTNKAQED